jgi:hypothetical protein
MHAGFRASQSGIAEFDASFRGIAAALLRIQGQEQPLITYRLRTVCVTVALLECLKEFRRSLGFEQQAMDTGPPL